MTMWPALGNVEQVIMDVRGNRQAISERRNCNEMGTIEMGMNMKTADTQTELIDGSNSTSPLDFDIINETATSDNNNQARLNINSLRDMKDLKCIDDDAASGHRILFTPDNPETKL